MQTGITMASWISMNSRLLCMPSRALNPTSGSYQFVATITISASTSALTITVGSSDAAIPSDESET
jgi:hypothetical protein